MSEMLITRNMRETAEQAHAAPNSAVGLTIVEELMQCLLDNDPSKAYQLADQLISTPGSRKLLHGVISMAVGVLCEAEMRLRDAYKVSDQLGPEFLDDLKAKVTKVTEL